MNDPRAFEFFFADLEQVRSTKRVLNEMREGNIKQARTLSEDAHEISSVLTLAHRANNNWRRHARHHNYKYLPNIDGLQRREVGVRRGLKGILLPLIEILAFVPFIEARVVHARL